MHFSTPRYFLLLLCCLLGAVVAQAQKAPIRISGQVVQADTKEPVRGASVLVVGSMRGMAADSLGKFGITISPDDTLLIRAIGFKPQLYTPTSRTASELKPLIKLEVDTEVMKEVEVSGRPSDAKIRTALNNMKRKEPSVTENPNPKPIVPEAMPTTPVEANALQNPISYFSKKEREKRALQQILDRVESYERYKREQEAKQNYNKLFKDNRGYQR